MVTIICFAVILVLNAVVRLKFLYYELFNYQIVYLYELSSISPEWLQKSSASSWVTLGAGGRGSNKLSTYQYLMTRQQGKLSDNADRQLVIKQLLYTAKRTGYRALNLIDCVIIVLPMRRSDKGLPLNVWKRLKTSFSSNNLTEFLLE